MTQQNPVLENSPAQGKSLWPIAALILIVVFAPAMVAAAIMMLRP